MAALCASLERGSDVSLPAPEDKVRPARAVSAAPIAILHRKMDFSTSYLGRLRALVGDRLLLVPGMRIVVEREDGAILLQLRSDYRLWGLPGGVPEEGEGADETVIRETLEETGIEVLDPKPFGFASDPGHEIWTYPNGDRCHYFTLLYAARHFTGEVIGGNDESLKIGWFRPDELPPLLPVMRRTLEAYASYRRTGAFQMI